MARHRRSWHASGVFIDLRYHDWVYLKLNDPERETILCKDPFQAHDERVERLIRSF